MGESARHNRTTNRGAKPDARLTSGFEASGRPLWTNQPQLRLSFKLDQPFIDASHLEVNVGYVRAHRRFGVGTFGYRPVTVIFNFSGGHMPAPSIQRELPHSLSLANSLKTKRRR